MNIGKEIAVILGRFLTNIPKARDFSLEKEPIRPFLTLYGDHQYLEPLQSILTQTNQERQVRRKVGRSWKQLREGEASSKYIV